MYGNLFAKHVFFPILIDCLSCCFVYFFVHCRVIMYKYHALKVLCNS